MFNIIFHFSPGEMSLDDLLEKYRGAYSEDFEMPSASDFTSSSEEDSDSSEDVEDSEGDHSSGQSSSTSGISIILIILFDC